MSKYKILDVVEETVLLRRWQEEINNSKKHTSPLIKDEFQKLKELYLSKTEYYKKVISKLGKLHDAAKLIDSDFKHFDTIGPLTLFLEEKYFKPLSLSKVPVDIRLYSIDKLLEITEKLFHSTTRDADIEFPNNKDTPDLPTYKHLSDFIKRQDQLLSYALLKIAESNNVEQYKVLESLLQNKTLDSKFYTKYLAERAEFGTDLVKYEQKLETYNHNLRLPELSVRRFVKEQYLQEAEALKNQ